MDNLLFSELSKIGFLIAGIWAVIQFWSANEFKKSQYISELWRKFYTTDTFVQIFDILDRDDFEQMKTIDSKDIYTYLAFLEEVVIFRRTKFYQIYKLRNRSLVNLFQFHFYEIYINSESASRKILWQKILKDNTIDNIAIDNEIIKHYWKLQLDFAKLCAKSI